MADLSGYPYFELEFDKNSRLVNPQQFTDLVGFLTSPSGRVTSDIIVMAHGWNNDLNEARKLYADFFSEVRSVMDASGDAKFHSRKFVVAGIFWPSKKFADADLIPGGAAALNSSNVSGAILGQLQALEETLESHTASEFLTKAASMTARLDGGPQTQDAWVDLLRQAVQTANEPEYDGADNFLRLAGNELFEILRAPTMATPVSISEGGAVQLTAIPHDQLQAAALFGGLLSDVKGAALRILNYATYYVMKNRSGQIGLNGVNPQIGNLQKVVDPDIRVHLVGHSFGGRLVTATANGPSKLRLQSVTLLQAAYSHYGMAENYDGQGHDGYFRAVVSQEKVTGPILVTHSVRDLAVGIAYAIASRIARQVAAVIGDANDPYGGMGRNGTQKTPEARFGLLRAPDESYMFCARVPNNLNGDQIIQSHSDICRPEIANALLHAM